MIEEMNRYGNILSFYHSNVSYVNSKIDSEDIDEDKFLQNYVNANYIYDCYDEMQVPGKKNNNVAKPKFIGTQGPIPKSFVNFWKMIWEEKVKYIFMLCGIDENGIYF